MVGCGTKVSARLADCCLTAVAGHAAVPAAVHVAGSGAVEPGPVAGAGERGEHVCGLHGTRQPDHAVAGVGADRLHPGDITEPGGHFTDAAAAAHAADEQVQLTHDGLTSETPSALTPSHCAAVLSARCPLRATG